MCCRWRRVRHAQEATEVLDTKKTAQEFVHATLLHLSTRLPSREGGIGNLEQMGQFFLRETQGLALTANFRWKQQPGFNPKRIKKAVVRLVVEHERAAVLAFQHGEIGDFDVMLAAIMLHVRGIGWEDGRRYGPPATVQALAQSDFHGSHPSS
jgi:hypothetical protein